MVVKNAEKEEDCLGDFQSSREADRRDWQIPLLQDNELDHHAGLEVAPLVTNGARSHVEYDQPSLR